MSDVCLLKDPCTFVGKATCRRYDCDAIDSPLYKGYYIATWFDCASRPIFASPRQIPRLSVSNNNHHGLARSNATATVNPLLTTPGGTPIKMPSTRSSARQAAAAAGSSPAPSQGKQTPTASTGDKRKASSVTPSKSKRGKKNETKEQTTIEATMPTEQKDTDSKEVEMKDAGEEKSEKVAEESSKPATGEGVEPTHQTNGEAKEDAKVTANGEVQEQSESATKVEEIGKVEPNASAKSGGGVSSGDAVEESSQREKSTPASILEKGIIYFFFRGRVGIDEPSDVNEIARSYIILRPIPHGAKLGDGPIGDANTNRMLALPKKVLPAGPKDRFMVFVEKAKESMDDIKGSLSSSDYATKTAGTRHSPAAAPVAEGIYAITTTGRYVFLHVLLRT